MLNRLELEYRVGNDIIKEYGKGDFKHMIFRAEYDLKAMKVVLMKAYGVPRGSKLHKDLGAPCPMPCDGTAGPRNLCEVEYRITNAIIAKYLKGDFDFMVIRAIYDLKTPKILLLKCYGAHDTKEGHEELGDLCPMPCDDKSFSVEKGNGRMLKPAEFSNS